MRVRKVTKVTNPISDFTFLSTAKSGKSRIKNPFWIRRKEHSQHILSDPRNEVVEKKSWG